MGTLMEDLAMIPDHLQDAAKKKLNGKKSVKVSFSSNGMLSKFAAKHRKKKRRMQKQSRKGNR